VPAKKTTRTTAPAPRSTTRRAARPAAPRAERAKRTPPAAPAAAPEVALDAAAVAPAAPPAATAPRRAVTREDIQVRAYFLALENAGQGGSLDYWLAAERELLQSASSRD